MAFEDQTFKVTFDRLDHRITSFGFRIEEKPHPGELLIDKVRAAKIPSGPVYAALKAGETVTLPDGRIFDLAERLPFSGIPACAIARCL